MLAGRMKTQVFTTAPDAATGNTKLAVNEITDPLGYAQRWGFSKRKVSD